MRQGVWAGASFGGLWTFASSQSPSINSKWVRSGSNRPTASAPMRARLWCRSGIGQLSTYFSP